MKSETNKFRVVIYFYREICAAVFYLYFNCIYHTYVAKYTYVFNNKPNNELSYELSYTTATKRIIYKANSMAIPFKLRNSSI